MTASQKQQCTIKQDKSELFFTSDLVAQGKIPDEVTAKYNDHAYLLYNHAVCDMIADSVLLIGDAAGWLICRVVKVFDRPSSRLCWQRM